jgi:hypothetical protein
MGVFSCFFPASCGATQPTNKGAPTYAHLDPQGRDATKQQNPDLLNTRAL